MSGGDRLGRVYGQLGPAELARLVIAAVARVDEREAGRVAAATPVSTWTGPVGAYEEVLDAAQRALRVGLVAGAVSARLVAVDALLEALEFVVGRQRDAAVEVCRLASACGLDDERVEEVLTALHDAQERAVTGVCHAGRAKPGRAGRCDRDRVKRSLTVMRASASGLCRRWSRARLMSPDFRDRASIEGVKPDWAAVDEVLARRG